MLELISETNYREAMENTVEPKLASIREELSLPLEDGGTPNCTNSRRPRARSSCCMATRRAAKSSAK